MRFLRLLLVEDSEDDARLILREMKRGGYDLTWRRVWSERDFERALDETEWDLVLSDYSLPGFTGLSVLEAMKARGLDIPFILLSGAIGEEVAVQVMKAGAHDYLMKGNLSRLIPAVERELRDCEMRREHRRTEQELARSEERLRQAQKMEAVGRLAGGIAHDFNNLLTVISGYNDLTLAELDGANPQRSNLERVREAAEKASSLTHQLLTFSRRQVMAPQILDLNAIIQEMSRMLRPVIREDIKVTLLPAEGLPLVKADPGQVQMVVMNLVLNARDAMPQGGELQLETAKVDLDAPLEIPCAPFMPGRYAMIAVTDTGMGMDERTKEHLFEPFFTTKEAGKGTGLGLATVYGIVCQSGGQIEVDSEPGKGTRVKVFLPEARQAQAADVKRPAHEPAGRTSAGNETILLVEDEDAVRSLVGNVLSRGGYRVLECRNGAEALRMAREPLPIHLLITDMVMPGLGGRQVAETFRSIHRKAGIVFISGYSDHDPSFEELAFPGSGFLQKPFTRAHLLRKVREVLDTLRADATMAAPPARRGEPGSA